MIVKVECKYEGCCEHYMTNSCVTCLYNKLRNYPTNKYEKAQDNSLEGVRRVDGYFVASHNVTRDDVIYRCPACGCNYSGYALVDKDKFNCEDCGLPITTKSI